MTDELAAGLDFPEADRIVEAGGDGSPAIGREGHARDPGRVTREPADLAASLRVPEDQRRIAPAGKEIPAIRRDGYPPDRGLVPLQRADRTGGLRIPDPDREIGPLVVVERPVAQTVPPAE